MSPEPMPLSERERLYRRILPLSGSTTEEIAGILLLRTEELRDLAAPLLASGTLTEEDGRLFAQRPHEALAAVVRKQVTQLSDVAANLERVSAYLPALGELGLDEEVVEAQKKSPVLGEAMGGEEVPDLLSRWVRRSTGDVSFLRPDQWQRPTESSMALLMSAAVQEGRRVRAIYPFHALTAAPGMLASRMAIGEEVRLVPQVPTRLAIIGGARALLPDPPGVGVDRVIAIRNPAIVMAVQLWFDDVWGHGMAAPGVDEMGGDPPALLVRHLAAGMKDEQIARSLGVSLRTVRRRIADLLADLGVDSRFQAGVEAARRGWL